MNFPVEKEFLHNYLHKIDDRPIFDIEQADYHYLKKLLTWTVKDSKINLCAATQTEMRLKIQIDFLNPSLFRFRATPASEVPAHPTEMVLKTNWPGATVRQKNNGESVEFETEQLILYVQKNPWSLQILDKNRKVLFDDYAYGTYREPFYVFPVGVRKQGDAIGFFQSGVLDPGEQMYGFGEKFGPLSKRHRKMLSWNSDATQTATDRSYKNIPFFLSSKGYGIFVNSTHRIHYEMGNPSFVSFSFEVEEELLDYYWFYGPRFKAIIKDYTRLTGRPEIPPLWSLGLWMSRAEYKSGKQVEEVAVRLRQEKIPADVLHLDPSWMRQGKVCDFVWNETDFPKPKEMLHKLHEQHFKVSLWEQPYVSRRSEVFAELDRKGFFLKKADGKTYLIPTFNHEYSGIIDFTNPAARKWYREKHLTLLKLGAGVFKTDMAEAVPEDARAADGRDGKALHNIYSLLYNQTVYEVSKAFSADHALVWGRSGYAGSQRYPVGWSGDPHSTWQDMACVLRAGLSASLSGIAFWSHDIGGFQGPAPSPELYIRWAQWGLLSSHSRCHGMNPREPWVFGEKAVEIFRKFDELRYALHPYLYSLAREASETGWPVVRPLVLEFQDVPAIYVWEQEYLLGRDLLIVPVFDPEGNVTYYLPPGDWLNFWTKEKIGGNRIIQESVPLDKIPIFIRDNAIIPMTRPSQYTGEKPWDPLEILFFIRNGRSAILMNEDRSLISILVKHETGKKAVTVSACRKQIHLRFLAEENPGTVTLDGNRLRVQQERKTDEGTPAAWYSKGEHSLHVAFNGAGKMHEMLF